MDSREGGRGNFFFFFPPFDAGANRIAYDHEWRIHFGSGFGGITSGVVPKPCYGMVVEIEGIFEFWWKMGKEVISYDRRMMCRS